MCITKLYLFILEFASGSIEAPDSDPALAGGIWRARCQCRFKIDTLSC